MTSLRRLSLESLDALARVRNLQTLLQIALDQEEFSPLEGAQSKMALLIDTYLTNVEPWLENLEINLERSRQLIAEEDS